MTRPPNFRHAAGRLNIDPARDLRHQLWLGVACFVLMVCGLVAALYALTADRRVGEHANQTVILGSRALQTQLALVDLRRRAEQALRSGTPLDAEIERSASAVNEFVQSMVLLWSPEAGEAARRAIRAAVEDNLRLYRRLASQPADGLAARSQRADVWLADSAAYTVAADAGLRELLGELNRTAAQEEARAANFALIARNALIALAVLTALVGLLFGGLALRAAQAHRALYGHLDALAHTDGLTGVTNRRGLDDILPLELERAQRLGYPLSVVMLDLDYFKRFNDRRGHAAGDDLLRSAAQVWRQQLRPSDRLARYGGEEFTLILPSCDAQQAAQLVERLRPQTPESQTFSAGIAQRRVDETAAELLIRADAALMMAKRGGRNRTIIAGDQPQMTLPLRVVR
jgi:diguanylate cyclase (GGDEF)-like protein